MTARVIALVEGPTEEMFVKSVLAPTLGQQGVFVSATTSGHPRNQAGVPAWARAKRELLRLLKEDSGRNVTTMFDYYGMPAKWPGRDAASGQPHSEKASTVERRIKERIAESMDVDPGQIRFIPYVQMHEFEALLFSAPGILAEVVSRDARPHRVSIALERIAESFETPEEIDDSYTTAPSKRILAVEPQYQKVTDGNLAATRIGLDIMREKCPHFNGWLSKLEALGQNYRTGK